MGKGLKPDLYIKSVFDLDVNWLKERGIKGVLLDIDNTLVTHKQKIPDEKVVELIKRFQENGIKAAIVSNARKKRVAVFNEKLGLYAKHRAFKPSNRGFLKAMSDLNLAPEETAVIGDQLFTDIRGGNRIGLTTILVDPLDKNEPATVRIKRIFEKLFLKRKPWHD
ncbi:HAD superfamily (subfamily IIIA) phosphatase, TIGR01668 [Thermoclostridium stercorarium subsp. stercorarium DSM 8532]|uniref:HAD superfamily (Subfamily IIIA) phosphatase, TIGR01668 n=3 Tax=Thermoclostridium stercorarium TaxID=1510 RepID=L7VJJ8_THES1|nr:YqeG family HAD IIIA-type phosphatase [Thermoclostridium stercorarium]AGC68265.1 HAD superfamily (subfamily IIIA) phosphatase, TIGR01668 [Thermoclostridium stercorarium subsp. stercorarium DSM 8532]AGI39292.1 phosphatase [Thermoclostridium stercorarium subsp. stercorarium DSM 8532]ANW98625.1 HAD family hydrolase [Thermoclostridium stercorarium subsp. thermolacticum DSM 2910]ANX01166.1 HAD family hydrolase [Thermoclostridium stercorarium subsp. leptospartum DSM 9219]UZQ86780.1 YqeG family HA